VFVLPTHAEAFGISAVEASAVGLPVLATSVGGLSDVVLHGQTGYLFNVGDVETMARYLSQLTVDQGLRVKMGTAARALVETRFDARSNAERVVEVLKLAARRDREAA
jgi:glycosyltransferase involved in cell wall biosynthesis